MKTTKDMVDEDWERLALLDMVYVQEDEEEMWRQYLVESAIQHSPKYATVEVGKPKKVGKFEKYARVTIKGRGIPRTI